MTPAEYRTFLIEGILEMQTTEGWNEDALRHFPTSRLEKIYDTIAQLRSELMYARGQASQDVQTAQIIANNNAQTNALEQYLAPIPRPAYVVQNPNCCQQNTCGCGTGCGI